MLGATLWSPHPHLQRAKWTLDGFAAHTHGLRVLIEPHLRVIGATAYPARAA
jgi:hypothetical protein